MPAVTNTACGRCRSAGWATVMSCRAKPVPSTCWVRSSSATSSRARSSRSTARASGAAISRSISVARCARWSISTLHVPTVTSKGATSMPTARSRGACSSARRLPRRTSWSGFPTRASAPRWAMPRRAACRMKWGLSRTSTSAVRSSSLRRSCARKGCA